MTSSATVLGDGWIIIVAARNAQLKKTVRQLQHDLSEAQINVQLLLLDFKQLLTSYRHVRRPTQSPDIQQTENPYV